MKFTTEINFEVEIKKFERFDNIEFEYVEFTDELKREIMENFDVKKLRLVFDLTHKDPDGDGYSVHATASHRKKAKFEMNEIDTGVFKLTGQANIAVPLKVPGIKTSDFTTTLIYVDLWKGSEDEVKLEFEPILVSNFKLG